MALPRDEDFPIFPQNEIGPSFEIGAKNVHDLHGIFSL